MGLRDFSFNSRIVGIVLFVLVLAAVVMFAIKAFGRVDAYDFSEISLVDILPAFALITLGFVNRFAFWTVLTTSFGLKAPVVIAGRAFFSSLLGRYIPGKIGLFLIRLRAYEKCSKKIVAASLITEYIAAMLAACIIVIIGTVFVPVANPLLTRWLPAGLLLILSALLHPAILKRVINLFFRIFRRTPLDTFPRIRTILLVTGGYILTGMLHGLAFFVILNSFSQLSIELYPIVTGAYYLASLVGVIAIFSPGGLGVREGVLFILLPFVVSSQIVVISVILMRLLTLGSELFLSGVSSLICRYSKEKVHDG